MSTTPADYNDDDEFDQPDEYCMGVTKKDLTNDMEAEAVATTESEALSVSVVDESAGAIVSDNDDNDARLFFFR